MTTPKEQIMPGTFVVVDNKGKGINSPVLLFGGQGDNILPSVGEKLLISSKKFKKDGTCFVSVIYQKKEYTAYYCRIRYSTTAKKTEHPLSREEVQMLLANGKLLKDEIAKRFARMNIPG